MPSTTFSVYIKDEDWNIFLTVKTVAAQKVRELVSNMIENEKLRLEHDA